MEQKSCAAAASPFAKKPTCLGRKGFACENERVAMDGNTTWEMSAQYPVSSSQVGCGHSFRSGFRHGLHENSCKLTPPIDSQSHFHMGFVMQVTWVTTLGARRGFTEAFEMFSGSFRFSAFGIDCCAF